MPRYVLRPDADVKADWTEDAVGTAWSKLDEAIEYPTAPTTGSDRITTSSSVATSSQGVTTTTLGVGEEIISATAWVYGKAVDASNYYQITIYDGAGTAQLVGTNYTSGSFGWGSVTYVGLLSQAKLDALEIRIISVGTGALEVCAAYLEVTTTLQSIALSGRRPQIRTRA